MYPELLQIGPWTLRSYSVVSEIGIIVGIFFAYKAARRQGIAGETFFDLAIWTVIAGIVGSRLYYAAVNWEQERYWEEPIRILYSWEGGLVFQGAIVGSLLAMAVLMKRLHLPFFLVADLGALGLPIGHAIGRLACFFQGCCYGQETDLPWGVLFPLHDAAVHPTMIYEAIANLGIFLILWHVDKVKPFRGLTLALYLMLYSTVRFLNEFLRGDPAQTIGGLRLAQIVSLGTILAGALLLAYLWRANANASELAPEQGPEPAQPNP